MTAPSSLPLDEAATMALLNRLMTDTRPIEDHVTLSALASALPGLLRSQITRQEISPLRFAAECCEDDDDMEDTESDNCSGCGGDGYDECRRPMECTARHTPDGHCPCGYCGGSGLGKDQTVW